MKNYVIKIALAAILFINLILNIVILCNLQKVKSEVDDFKWNIESIESDISGCRNSISNIEDDIDSIESDIDSIEYYLY